MAVREITLISLVCLVSVLASVGMAQRTVLNEPYRGLVQAFPIPAEVHERDGRKYASFGSVVPIHCCTPEQVALYADKTHHYCDVFTEQTLAPLGELAYVRLDHAAAEKVFINRVKRLVVASSDGRLALWRAAPSFESANLFMAGTPIVNKEGELVSVVTAKRGNHYAVSTFEGEGGYFETSSPWKMMESPEGSMIYGERAFASRAELLAHVSALPPAEVGPGAPPRAVLHRGASPRVVLVAENGRQLAHHYLQGVLTTDIEYL